jgi:hypothetical protein
MNACFILVHDCLNPQIVSENNGDLDGDLEGNGGSEAARPPVAAKPPLTQFLTYLTTCFQTNQAPCY